MSTSIRTHFAAASLLAAAACTAAWAQPANNTCSNAQVIPSVPITINGTTVNATSDVSSSNCSATADDSIDVWYTFTNGPTPITCTIDTNGTPDTGGNAGDTSLEVFDVSCGGNSIGCDDDSGLGLNSRVVVILGANQTIKIRVAFLSNCPAPPEPGSCQFAGTVTGPFVLNLSVGVPPPPPNDSCANATLIATSPSVTLGDNDLSTGVDITPCSNTDEQDVWFSFTPATSGQYRIDTLGSTGNADTSLAVYQGCPNELTPHVQPNWPANLIGCNDDKVFTGGANDDYLSMIKTNLTAGAAYKIRVSGFNNTTGGFVLNLSGPTAALPAIPDTCATAQAVTGTFTQTYNTEGARPDGPPGACNAATAISDGANDNAIWFTFVPGATGMLSGTINGEFGDVQSDSILIMYSGTCGSLTELACLDDDVATATYNLGGLPAVTAGTSYYLVFADYGQFDSGCDVSVSITVPGGAAPGACCAGSTCSLLASGACTGANTLFVGSGSACNAPGNATSPCCKADFNQSGSVTVQDIFDFLGGYFSGSSLADVSGGGGVTVQDIFDFLAAYFVGCA